MMSETSESVQAQAFEFWSDLAEEESDRMISKTRTNQGYVHRSQGLLLDLVLKGLLKINFDANDDGDEMGTHISSLVCL